MKDMDLRSEIASGHVATADHQFCPGCGVIHSTMPGKFSAVCESCLLGFALGEVAGDTIESAAVGQLCDAERSFGSYAVLEEIGRGGMGVIYRAVHRETGETVALKTVREEYIGCAETRTRFEHEAEAAACLDHPNVMPIYEVGEGEDHVPFFSMKLAESGSLHHLIEKYYGRWRQIAELMIKIAEAVHHAHEHGVLHRDLKPGNILFGEEYEPLVTDFGLAKRVTTTDALTQSCSILGTPSYIAPEQAAGRTKEVTVSADVYGLGAILYELLTGQPPFVGDNPLDVLRQVAEKSPRRPTQLVATIPKTLETICLRCLRRTPQHRYGSAQHFADDLALWLEGKRITAVPRDPWFSKSRWSGLSFYRRTATALVMAVALIIAWIVGSRVFSPLPIGTVAVVIEDWSDGSSLGNLAHEAASDFKQCITQTGAFRILGGAISDSPLPDSNFDPVAYGRANHAQLVLTGCVRRSGKSARLITRLVNCNTGKAVWHRAECFPMVPTGKTLQSVSEASANDIASKWRADRNAFLQPSGLAPSSEAQKLYTRATELVARTNRRDLDAAAALMQRAVAADPQFSLASGTLALTLWTQAEVFGEPDKIPLAMAAAEKTLALDSNSAQAHRVIAACYSKSARHDEALEEFWTALEIEPQSVGCCQSLAICLRELGQPCRSIQWLKRATELDPSRGTLYLTLAESLAICGYDQEAEKALAQANELDGDQAGSEINLSVLRTWQNRFADARQMCAKARAQTPDMRCGAILAAWIEFCAGNDTAAEIDFESLRNGNSYEQNWDFYGAVNPTSALAFLAKKAGFNDRARALGEDALKIDQELLIKYPHNARILHDLAATCAITAKTEQALDYLEQAFAAGWAEQRSTVIDPRFSALTSLPRFKELTSKKLEGDI